MRLAGTVQENFARAVREAQAEAERDVDVERCKDYIALHLTEKLSVTRMAEELQILRSQAGCVPPPSQGARRSGAEESAGISLPRPVFRTFRMPPFLLSA